MEVFFMKTNVDLPYFTGDESYQFSFIRLPRKLMIDPRFAELSTDAKVLYCLFLDRMGISVKNDWKDEVGRIYIHYSLAEIQKDLQCSHGKAVKLLAALDNKTGVGLIERVKRGQGRPTRIYVKQFYE